MFYTPVGVRAIVIGYRQFNKDLLGMQGSIAMTGGAARGAAGQFLGLGSSVVGVASKMALIGTAAAAGLALAVGAIGVAAIKTSMQYESAFAGVLKTTDGLLDDNFELNALGQKLRTGFLEMARTVPMSADELAGIGEIAGQLGVKFTETDSSLLEFTKTIADLSVTTNLTVESAASDIAKLQNIFGVNTDEMGVNAEHIGSTIVALGNNFATTEQDIVNFSRRMGGASAIAGFTEADVLAIAAAMSAVGVQAEAGGTAVQKTMLAINTEVASAGKSFIDNSKALANNSKKMTDLNAKLVTYEARAGMTEQQMRGLYDSFIAAGGSAEEFGRQLGDTNRAGLFKTIRSIDELNAITLELQASQGQAVDPSRLAKFAQVAGMSATEFATAWQTDASSAFNAFVVGLGESGDDAAGILKDLGLNNQRLIRAFLSLSGAGDLLDRSLTMANDSWDENTALTIEAQKRYMTTESQLAMMRNRFREVGVVIGDSLTPYLKRALVALTPFVEKLGEELPKFVKTQVLPILDQLFASIDSLVSSFATGGGTGLMQALGFSPELITFIQNVKTEVSNLIASFGEGGTSSNFLKNLSDTILPKLNEVLAFVTDHWEEFKSALIAVAAILGSAAIASILATIGLALASLLSPFGLIVGAIVGLKMAWDQNWGGIQEKFFAVWATIQPVLAQIGTFITNTFQTVVDWFVTNWPVIQAVALTAWTVIQAIIQSVVAVIVEQVWPQLMEAFDALTEALAVMGLDWSDVGRAVVAAVGIIASVIGAVLLTAIGVAVGAINAIAAAANALAQTIANVMTYAMQALEGFITFGVYFIEAIKSILNGESANTTFALFAKAWQGLADGLSGVAMTIISLVQGFVDATLGIIMGFVTGFVGFFENLYTTLVGASIVPDICNGIIGLFQGIVEPVTTAINTVGTTVTGVFESIKEAIGIIAEPLQGVAGWLAGLIVPEVLEPGSPTPFETGLQGVAATLAGGVIPQLQAFTTAMGTANVAVDTFVSDSVSSVDQFGLACGAIFEDVLNTLRSVLKKMTEAVQDIDWSNLGEYIVNGIAKGVSDNASTATGAMKDLVLAMIAAAKAAAGVASPAKEFIPIGSAFAAGIMKGIAGIARFDTKKVWDDFVRQNLADAFTAMNDLPRFSKKISNNADWLDFVDDLGYKRYWEQAWNELAATMPLDMKMGDLYMQILKRTGELVGDQWSSAFQAANAHMYETIWDQIADVKDMTIAQFAELGNAVVDALQDVGSKLAGVANFMITKWNEVGLWEASARLRELEKERLLREDTAEIDAQIAAERQKIADTQASIYNIQKAQQDMEMLGQQMDLLNLIRDYGLNPSQILNGVKLGLGADISGILQATSAAMQAIVQQLEFEVIGAVGGSASIPGAATSSAGSIPSVTTNTANFNVAVNNGMDVGQLQGLFNQWSAGMLNA